MKNSSNHLNFNSTGSNYRCVRTIQAHINPRRTPIEPSAGTLAETAKVILYLRQSVEDPKDFEEPALRQLADETSHIVALQILARFSETLGESIGFIEHGLREDSTEKIWRAAHKVAGTADLVGFRTFGTSSRRLDKDLQMSSSLETHRMEVEEYLAKAKNLLEKIRSAFSKIDDYL